MKLALQFAALFASVAALNGCIIVDSSTLGALSVQTTINGATAPTACAAHGATFIELTVDGSTYREYCTDYYLTKQLTPGIYSAQVRLVDANFAARTTTATTTVEIFSNDTTSLPVDFPENAFY